MKYDSLLLNCGGGIINPTTRSPQFSQSAALCIGIGGTGIAALCDLKGKIYQQLMPDNPGEPVPRYDAIQLLGIDTDETAFAQYGGNRRLSDGEFFSIKKDNLNDFFQKPQGKQLIKDDPMMSWMEIDKINEMLSPQGAGGIRQMGRFMLLSKASSLFTEIQGKCRLALRTRECNSLDIYIFAGISGGTGSGCFLDTCYLVRKVVEANGWNASIMGYFFLPDVVTSKPEVASKPASVAYNNSNGYAAMKELDYLMNLKESHDWFEQNYGTGITIRTQLAPVDMCHLVSATRADGTMVLDGFHYGINVASDYAMAYLAEVDLKGEEADESKLTMRGHLANVTRGVLGIPRRWGANLSYHILGASNAEIPMTQINTYLAAGFIKKFAKAARKPRNEVTQAIVMKLMQQMRFTPNDVYASVVANNEALNLPEIDRKVLAGMPVAAKGKLNQTWADCANSWVSVCDGNMVKNMNGLTKPLDGFAYQNINDQSLIGRLFRFLWDLSMNPDFGPYYAAYLLSNSGNDLYAALTGAITTADGEEQSNQIQLSNMQDWVVQLNQDLVDKKGRRKEYDNYYQAVNHWLNTDMARNQWNKTAATLRNLRTQVEELYNSFFRPLCEMLDNLLETFKENETYLTTDQAKQANAYTWQILSLEDIKPRLNNAIDALNANQLITSFVGELLTNSSNWLKNDEDKITMLIRKFMLALFANEANRSLQDYLFDIYPAANGNATELAKSVERDILKKIHDSAIPMFWCDSTYSISDPTYTFESSSLSVPSSCSAICAAAANFSSSHAEYAVRQTGIGDRIFALRFVSGIPLFAYLGITKLKADYDAAGGSASGAGSHLYSKTDRAKKGALNVEWRTYLPTPMPYSRAAEIEMHPEGEKWVRVYHEAVERGIIGVNSVDNEYAIFVTPDLEVKDYTVQDFMDGELFSKARYEAELNKIQKQIRELHLMDKNPDCKALRLKNDGNEDLCKDKEAVRIDYFVQYTVMQRIVLKEIEKDKKLKAAEEQLKNIYDEYFAYDKDLANFMNLMFHRVLDCRDMMDEVNYEKTATVMCGYKDHYGDPQNCYLVQNANEYQLYYAFCSYRQKLNGNAAAWEKLEKALEEIRNATLKFEDTFVAAILEQVWDNRAMEKLRTGKLRGEAAGFQSDVLRFYNGLRTNILNMKRDMPQWPRGRSVEDLTAAITGKAAQADPAVQTPPQAPAQLPEYIFVGYNNEHYVIFTKQYRNYACHRVTGQWIPLNPNMPHYNG